MILTGPTGSDMTKKERHVEAYHINAAPWVHLVAHNDSVNVACLAGSAVPLAAAVVYKQYTPSTPSQKAIVACKNSGEQSISTAAMLSRGHGATVFWLLSGTQPKASFVQNSHREYQHYVHY